MTQRLLPWISVALVLAAGAGGWIAWKALAARSSAEEDPGDVPLAVPQAPSSEMDPRLRAAIELLLEADKATDPGQRTAKAKAAVAKVTEAERSRTGDPAELAFWRGIAAVMAGDDREAKAALERVRSTSRLGRRDSRAYFLYAKVLAAFEPDKLELAVRHLRTLKAQVPDFMPEPVDLALFDGLKRLAARHVNKRDPDGGVAHLQEAILLTRIDLASRIDARRELVRALGRAGRWLESRDEAAALLELSKGRSLPDRYMLAVAYAAQNQWGPAVEHYSAVVAALDEGRVPEPGASVLREALLRRGNARRYLGDLAGSKADLERYVAEMPEDGRGHYWLGMYHLDGHDDARAALPHLEKARALLPWCDDPLRALLMIYEVQVPDPVKAKALKEEIDGQAEQRKKERERVGKERTTESGLCQ
jgi:tetratricopeptide (TPR) repeat protein